MVIGNRSRAGQLGLRALHRTDLRTVAGRKQQEALRISRRPIPRMPAPAGRAVPGASDRRGPAGVAERGAGARRASCGVAGIGAGARLPCVESPPRGRLWARGGQKPRIARFFSPAGRVGGAGSVPRPENSQRRRRNLCHSSKRRNGSGPPRDRFLCCHPILSR